MVAGPPHQVGDFYWCAWPSSSLSRCNYCQIWPFLFSNFCGNVAGGPWRWHASQSVLKIQCCLWGFSWCWKVLFPVEVIGGRAREKPWFHGQCCRVCDMKQTTYHRWAGSRTVLSITGFERRRGKSIAFKMWLNGFSTLERAIFGPNPSTTPLIGEHGRIIADPAAKSNLLMRNFDSKQCHDIAFDISCQVRHHSVCFQI